MRRFVFFFFAVCVLASLWLGSNLVGVQQSAQNMVESVYPLRYNVALENGTSLKNVTVRFDDDTAYLSNGEAVAVSSAEFVSVNPDMHRANSVRVGFVSIILSAVMVSALLGITGFTTVLCIVAVKENNRRRKAELRRQRRARRARIVAFEDHRAAFSHQAA